MKDASNLWVKESEEVYYCQKPMYFVDSDTVKRLKEIAEKTPRGRARLCLHSDLNLDLHQMLIVHPADAYVRPHKHVSRDETFQICEGSATLYIFDEGGAWHKQSMGPAGSTKPFLTLVPRGTFHSIRIDSPTLVFLEATTGPFDASDTIMAPWSPATSDHERVEEFLSALKEEQSYASR